MLKNSLIDIITCVEHRCTRVNYTASISGKIGICQRGITPSYAKTMEVNVVLAVYILIRYVSDLVVQVFVQVEASNSHGPSLMGKAQRKRKFLQVVNRKLIINYIGDNITGVGVNSQSKDTICQLIQEEVGFFLGATKYHFYLFITNIFLCFFILRWHK